MPSGRRTRRRGSRSGAAGAGAGPTPVRSALHFQMGGPSPRPGARSPRASPRHHRSVLRDTDCLPPGGRCSREHPGGARGRDGGDAGVRSCNAEGQGESSRSLASADPRPTSCVGAGCMSRRRRERLWRSGRAADGRGITRCDGSGATRLGAVPRSSAGADPSRGAGRWSYRGAALRLASCTRRNNGPQGMPRIVARPVGRETRSDHRTPRVSPMTAIRATHPTRCELHARPGERPHARRTPPRAERPGITGRWCAPAGRAGARSPRCAAPVPRCARRRPGAPAAWAPAPAAGPRRAGP